MIRQLRSDSSNVILFGTAILIQVVLLLVSADLPFFWDSIQFGSRHATFFHTQGIGWLPPGMDSGNPPLLGLLVHGNWLVFGRTLMASHAVIWPFALANLGLLALLGQALHRAQWGWAPLLFVANPVYAAQTTLVSPDVLLVTGLLLLWTGRQYTFRWMICLGAILLGAISLRGLALTGVVGVWWWMDKRHTPYVKWILLGLLPGLVYHFGHWLALGWAFLPMDSPWSGSFSGSSWQAIPRNAVILLWRLLDHGLIFLWVGLVLAWRQKSQLFAHSQEARWFVAMCLAVLPFFLFFSSLNMHRYLLPVFLAATLLFVIPGPSRILKWGVLLLLVSGNLWVYPDRIAQGWDATLAWLSFPTHREAVLKKMESEGISRDGTASAFPNLGPADELDLQGDQGAFVDWSTSTPVQYLLYSNVCNDFSDGDLERMKSWPVVFQSGKWPVRVVLFKIPEDETFSH